MAGIFSNIAEWFGTPRVKYSAVSMMQDPPAYTDEKYQSSTTSQDAKDLIDRAKNLVQQQMAIDASKDALLDVSKKFFEQVQNDILPALNSFMNFHEERKKAPLCCLHDYLENDPNDQTEDGKETRTRDLENLRKALVSTTDIGIQNYLTEYYFGFITENPELLALWKELGWFTSERLVRVRERLSRTKVSIIDGTFE